MTAPKALAQLVERYAAQRNAYLSPAYNETQLRRELLDPLFRLLGWDIENTQGFAEAYKDVVHEDHLRIGESTKAPDYAFRIGGTRKFFLEAKRPSVDISTDNAPAYQLRRYAWSAGLSLSVLSNFEQFAVYDTRIRPHKDDRASVARVLLVRYSEYVDRWDELANVFSRSALLRGAFDRFSDSTRLKRGTVRFDDAFLNDIEEWRKLLAQTIARENRALTQREVNSAVQLTLDRIVFLRIAEDRGIEPYGRLRDAAGEVDVYERLTRLFHQADDKYNSGLFHFRDDPHAAESPDRLTPSLTVDDKSLSRILRDLYYPDSPYEFSVVSLDVLGNIYERFLGKQITLTARGASIEEKPLVRKAGGVFYTPTHIVNFIVANTLGPLLKDKKPGPRGGASQVRILDPACGSGSFLIGAYQFLLAWHRDRYMEDGPQKHRRELCQTPRGGWALTIDEKKRILVNSIFGMDIDEQAVEVTKLSLLLKVLEGESAHTLERQLRLFHERALPNLSANIRCGNSLVGTDWYGAALTRLDGDTAFSVNPCDWHTEFRTVFEKSTGFDVILGNPPYVSLQSGFIAPDLQSYLEEHYGSYERITDYFALFLERAHTLLADGGSCGMIVPSTLLGNLSFTRLRGFLLKATSFTNLVQLGDGVFRDAVVPTCILTTRKPSKSKALIRVITDVEDLEAGKFESTCVRQSRFLAEPNFLFNLGASDQVDAILKQATSESFPLGTILNIKEGIKTGNDSAFLSDKRQSLKSRKVLKGRDIEPFAVLPANRYIEYDPTRLSRPQSPQHFEVPAKILVRRVGDRLVAALDEAQHYCVHTLYTARKIGESQHSLWFLLALLNSRLVNFVYRKTNPQKGKVFPEVRIYSINNLPVRTIDTPSLQRRADLIADLARRAASTASMLASADSPHDREVYGRQFAAVRDQVDSEVYALYGLTPKQVAEVEKFYKITKN